MMELKDFENFLEFTKKQITILKDKENDKYKDDSWKLFDEEDLFDGLYDQLDKYENTVDKEDQQRRLLHVANYAFFLYEKLKGS
ncbi:hypothetical protein LCGC14_1782370 [marine sediment metagenome]|uniref:Uncharacterized protein n=1 Tax=marine sediment metagenome TaxID=412755 RepID=A0A0F9GV53_9ZZZZ